MHITHAWGGSSGIIYSKANIRRMHCYKNPRQQLKNANCAVALKILFTQIATLKTIHG